MAYRQQAHLSYSQIHEPASMGVGHPLVDRRVVEIEAIGRCALSPLYRGRRWWHTIRHSVARSRGAFGPDHRNCLAGRCP